MKLNILPVLHKSKKEFKNILTPIIILTEPNNFSISSVKCNASSTESPKSQIPISIMKVSENLEDCSIKYQKIKHSTAERHAQTHTNQPTTTFLPPSQKYDLLRYSLEDTKTILINFESFTCNKNWTDGKDLNSG